MDDSKTITKTETILLLIPVSFLRKRYPTLKIGRLMFQQNWVVTSITGEFFYKRKKLTLNPCSLRKKQNLSLSF